MYVWVALVIFSVNWRTYLGVHCLYHCTTYLIFLKNQPAWPHMLCSGRWVCAQRSCSLPAGKRDGPPVLPSTQVSGLHQPGHRRESDFLLSTYKPCQRHLWACPELADETNQAGYPWPITQITPCLMDCSSFKRLQDSSWTASSIPMVLPFFPAMPHICSAST